jgi:hypothetical protein
VRRRQHRSATFFTQPANLEKCAETSNRYLISSRPPRLMRSGPPPFSLYAKSVASITPRKRTKTPFAAAVEQVAEAAKRLLSALETAAPPRNRETEAAKAKARAAQRFGVARSSL